MIYSTDSEGLVYNHLIHVTGLFLFILDFLTPGIKRKFVGVGFGLLGIF